MGVKGLWSLLNPVARPVQIESMEGKRLAIDSSIWLYQFQATMRDKDGRVLVNAHVLGFLRRINKLLFHGIKPVFVFDGGAPALKRATIAERKRRKAGAAANHARTAEKLFAAQMRREAVKAAQSAREEQAVKDAETAATTARADFAYSNDEGEQIAEDAVYLEDLEGRPGPTAPRPPPGPATRAPSTASIPVEADPREERRKKFRKHDPYKLPEATMPTVSTEEKPDARLATEEELKQFIDEMHPSDIDVESPEFRALPTEVQYEIIGDLRVRSRQQSHRRLADMLRAAPTALDFSMAQIKHLSQRNALTQQLLTVTDMVGKAHLTIPVRIAAERNREYVLVKRGESEGGGWALGIREGTKANPIKVENVDEEGSESGTEGSDESDDDIQAVSPPPIPSVDPDLREFRRKELLDAIVRRYTPKAAPKASLDVPVKSFGKKRGVNSAPLFADEQDQEDDEIVPTANDEALALALQQEELGSDEEVADEDLARALALSRREADKKAHSPALESDGETDGIQWSDQPEVEEPMPKSEDSDDSMEEVSLVPSASNRSTPIPFSHDQTPVEIVDSDDDDLVEISTPPVGQLSGPKQVEKQVTSPEALRKVDKALTNGQNGTTRAPAPPVAVSSTEMRPPPPVPSRVPAASAPKPAVQKGSADSLLAALGKPKPKPASRPPAADTVTPWSASEPPTRIAPAPSTGKTVDTAPTPAATAEDSREPAEPSPPPPSTPPRLAKTLRQVDDAHLPDFHPETPEKKAAERAAANQQLPDQLRSPSRRSAASLLSFMDPSDYEDPLADLRVAPPPAPRNARNEDNNDDDDDNEDSRSIEWSRSPSPRLKRPPLQAEPSGESIPLEVEDDEADMNRQDMVAEEDDYARFLAQIKNRDLNEVRTEIDDEIRVLNNQNKVAMRDSDEITQAMISQIQTLLRHFGIPYITAPMEAEAQCAKLAELGLVDGVITDDSDVFLFGGIQCFKNIFNDAKYAECFLLTDVERELSLTRERLISLAYLLGSDYTIGLPGVGPVVALEILASFPGERGISDFKDWWTRVQRGQDTDDESGSKWRKSFKKKYAGSIFLTGDWPNLLVREAYKYPTTDESEEPFHWGFPKLAALRSFLHEELSWSISKVDDELTPIVQRIARRGKEGSLNKQSSLNSYFDMSVVSGNYAPRRRTTANVSKRLMSVIKQFREAEAAVRGEEKVEWGAMMGELDEEDPKGKGTGRPKGKRKQSGESTGTPVEGEEVPKKKRASRKRKGTVSSVAQSEEGSESVVSSNDVKEGEEDMGEVAPAAPRGKAKAKSRGRGKGRGTRRWVGERWDVIERPD